MNRNDKKPELLAPAGTLEVFETAVGSGADAVYIGAPALNARALAKHFSMSEIAAMIDHAHNKGVKVYLAMNSLVREEELPLAARTLGMIEALGADGLILQDLGLYHLARRHFPGLRLHASTLMAAHNSLGVRQLAEMGFARVVLARELTMEEIGRVRDANPEIELEVFIHGALCFSYSGLCLFSSYLGGKSGLRGRCVQPCRRRYSWGGAGQGEQAGYFFSMHDLAGSELLSQIQAAGVTSFKIEGRMRSAQYVGRVVRAYRLVLDNPGSAAKIAEAAELLGGAMGRRTTPGYFPAAEPPGAFSPQHSGNIGHFLGRIGNKGNKVRLMLQAPVARGDRLRLHQEESGERLAFTLKELWRADASVTGAVQGEEVVMALPAAAAPGDSLYKVDTGERRLIAGRVGRLQPGRFAGLVKKLERGLRLDHVLQDMPGQRGKAATGGGRRQRNTSRSPAAATLPWQLRIDDLRLLKQPLQPQPVRLLVSLNRETHAQATRSSKLLKPYFRQLTWALPAIIEEKELEFFAAAIRELRQLGHRQWQLGHIGQLQLFTGKAGSRATLAGDYTLNVLNSLAARVLKEFGFQEVQLAIENDRDNLRRLCQHAGGMALGLTVYGRPPLFTARPGPPHFRYNQPLISPRGERFVLRREGGQTLAQALTPFSLLDFLPELAAAGLAYVVVDLSRTDIGRGDLAMLLRRMSGSGKPQRHERLSTFNYLGKLQ
jgi:U32 family peptidase